MKRSVFLVVALCVTRLALADDGDAASVRRFAVIAGANTGALDYARLRYATTDAERFATILRQFGGVATADSMVLKEPTRRALLASLEALADAVRTARVSVRRTEVLFYFSGHADAEGLQLGREAIGYLELRQALAAIPSDVRIAVLDACASGAITRFKGGRMQPAFLTDISSEVRGQAFLTSSTGTEAAQESDQLQGSFFTHALVSGLRGAADVSGDGKVTLSEAYAFAFDETLARTATTQGGSQHPTYDIKLAGTGDVVLTDLRDARAVIVIGAELEGRVSVRDASGRLVAELAKPTGRPVELAIEPGQYEVEYEQTGRQMRMRIVVTDGERREMVPAEMHTVRKTPTRLRGAPDPDPWTLAGRSRLFLRGGVSSLRVTSEESLAGTTHHVSGASGEIGYVYGVRKDIWLGLQFVTQNFDLAVGSDNHSGELTRVKAEYGGLFDVRGFAPVAGSIRPYGLLGIGVLSDYVEVESGALDVVTSSNAKVAFRVGGGVEARLGSHVSASVDVMVTKRNGHSSTNVGLGFGWTMGRKR